ncbi:beta-galactosidase small subunit [Fundicoccus sp. Sow4_H7]|uniref:beta-galactosidase small subunit n=1 Tax=Fundicoccus sp. Sow4_H7 TaxID=3438784 RepID=UPI003F8E5537
MENTKALEIIYGDVNLGVKGYNFHYMFNYSRGGLESLLIDDYEWLYRAPKPTFWRATTDNDRGNGFSEKSAMWFGADMFINFKGFEIKVDSQVIERPTGTVANKYQGNETAETIEIAYFYETCTNPATEITVTYLVEKSGEISVKVKYSGKKDLPELPAFGLRFVMPTLAESFEYKGLSGETYPDRKAGGVEGVYQVDDLSLTPYLVPQESNLHCDTSWVKVNRKTSLNNAYKNKEVKSLTFEKISKEFAFSCTPYTAIEVESATHHEELPLPRRTVLNIYGAVRGVGGIDSWGSNVEEPYRISAEEDIEYEFKISF